MLRFTLNVKNAQKIDFALSGVASGVRDFRSVWPRVVDLIGLKVEQAQFESKGGRGPAGLWAPYKNTHKGKAGGIKRAGETATLRDTNALYDSLTGHTENTIEKFQPLSMKFGTNAGGYQWQTMRRYPARRIFDFVPEDNRQIASFITDSVRRTARALGFKILGATGRDVTSSDALAAGIAALSGGPGASLANGF